MQVQFDDRYGVATIGKIFSFFRHTRGHICPGLYCVFIDHGLKSWFFGKILESGTAAIIYAVVDDFGDLVEVGHA